MSEFNRNAFEEMYSDADETLDHYDMAKHIYITQQAKIDELQGWIDELKITQNNLELKAEDAECVSMSLDDQGVEKCDDDGKSYSLWGRVCQFKKSNNITERDELQARIDRVVHILTYTNHASTPLCNELRDILKGNKDEN